MSSEQFTYAYKPRLMSPAYEFSLSKDSLDWTIGSQSGRISYPMIKRIRLGYKPTNMANSRFIAEIWSQNAMKLTIQSVSARNIIDVTDHGNDYARFLRELNLRVDAANPKCIYEAGFPAWRWWPSLGVGVITLAALLYVVARSLVAAEFVLAGIIGGIGAWFLWQIWNIVMRNRPRNYDPKNLPTEVLSASKA
jgi:hypothetical protein